MRAMIPTLLLALMAAWPVTVQASFCDAFEYCESLRNTDSSETVVFQDYWDASGAVTEAQISGDPTSGERDNECYVYDVSNGNVAETYLVRSVTGGLTAQYHHLATNLAHLPSGGSVPIFGMSNNDGVCGGGGTCTSGNPPHGSGGACSVNADCDTAGCYVTAQESAEVNTGVTDKWTASLFWENEETVCDQGSRNPFFPCTAVDGRDPDACAETQDLEGRCLALPYASALVDSQAPWEELLIAQNLVSGTIQCRLFHEGAEAGGDTRPSGVCAFDQWPCSDNTDCEYVDTAPDPDDVYDGRCSDWVLENPYPENETLTISSGSKMRCRDNNDCRTCASDADCGGAVDSCDDIGGRCVCEVNTCTVPTPASLATEEVWIGKRYESTMYSQVNHLRYDDWCQTDKGTAEDWARIRLVNGGPEADGDLAEWTNDSCNSIPFGCINDWIGACDGSDSSPPGRDYTRCIVNADCDNTNACIVPHGADDGATTGQSTGQAGKRNDVLFPTDLISLANHGTCDGETATTFGSCQFDSSIRCFDDTDCVESLATDVFVTAFTSARDAGELCTNDTNCATDDNLEEKYVDLEIFVDSVSNCGTGNCLASSISHDVGEHASNDRVPILNGEWHTDPGSGTWTLAELNSLGIRFTSVGPDTSLYVSSIGVVIPVKRTPFVKPRAIVEQGDDSEITVVWNGDSTWANGPFHTALTAKVQQPDNLCEMAAGGKKLSNIVADVDGDNLAEFLDILNCEGRTSELGGSFNANMLRGTSCVWGTGGSCEAADVAFVNLKGNDLHRTAIMFEGGGARCWNPSDAAEHGGVCECPHSSAANDNFKGYCLAGADSYQVGYSAQSVCDPAPGVNRQQTQFYDQECSSEPADWTTSTIDTCTTNDDCDRVDARGRVCVSGECACCPGTNGCAIETFEQTCDAGFCTGKFYTPSTTACTADIDCAIPPAWCSHGCINVAGCMGTDAVCMTNSSSTLAGVMANFALLMELVDERNNDSDVTNNVVVVWVTEQSSGPLNEEKRCTTEVDTSSKDDNKVCLVDSDCEGARTCVASHANQSSGWNACWEHFYRDEVRANQTIISMAKAWGQSWMDLDRHFRWNCPYQTQMTCTRDGRHYNNFGDDIASTLIADALENKYGGGTNGLCNLTTSMCKRGAGCDDTNDPTGTCPVGGVGEWCDSNDDCDTYSVDLQ